MTEQIATYGARKVLAWEDVRIEADEILNVWVLGSELEWAERAWAMLEKAGLTSYGDAVEETRVRVRLLALASLYWDFCLLGADERFGWDELHEYGTEVLGIPPFRLGQIVGAGFEASDFAADDRELAERALRRLIDEDRPVIGSVLVAGHGDDWTFLKSLFATTSPADSDDQGELELSKDEIKRAAESFSMETARVMGWIMEGMPTTL